MPFNKFTNSFASSKLSLLSLANAYSNEIVAQELLDMLDEKQEKSFRQYYKLPDDKKLDIANISIERNWLLTGGSTDRERTSVYILRDFREGKIGKFILDKLE